MRFGHLMAVVSLVAVCLPAAEAQIQVMVELQDSSQLRGSVAPISLAVDSPALGKLQVGLDRIALLICDGPKVKLTLRNGDRLAGTLALPEIRLQTLVGEITVPLAQLRQLETLDADGVPTTLMEGLVWHPRLAKAAQQKVPNDGVPELTARVVGAQFTADHRARTNAAVLLTNRLAGLEAHGAFGNQPVSAMSICGWVKVEGAHLEEPVCLIGLGSARRPHASLSFGTDEELIWHSGGNNNNAINQPLDPSVWTFVAGTRNGTVLALYLNGVQVQTQTDANENFIGRPDTFVVGRPPQAWEDAPEVPAAGNNEPAEPDKAAETPGTKIMVSDVRIYNRALNAEEIRRLYEATKK